MDATNYSIILHELLAQLVEMRQTVSGHQAWQ